MTIGKGSELEEKMTEYYSGKNIEQDVVEKILSTQPPKTLMRFKCVSKWWHDLISSPRFISKHVFNSKHNDPSNTCVLVKRFFRNIDTTTTNESEMVFSLLHFSYDNENDCSGSINLSSVEDIGIVHGSLHIVGHCNGIVCLATIDYDENGIQKAGNVYLWNPATQDFRFLSRETFRPDWSKVPLFIGPTLTEKIGTAALINIMTMAFGYDPKSDDYKVVDILFSGSKSYGPYGDDPQEDEHVIVYPPRAVLYTTGTDSWREIKTSSLERETTYLWPQKFQLYLKGMCFWLGFEQLKEFPSFFDIRYEEHIGQKIISLNTSDEVFREIMLPYELLDFKLNDFEECLELRLTVWNEFVALFGFRYTAGQAMWIIDDDLGGWRKHITFKLEYFFHQFPERTLAFWKSNEILGVGDNGLIICYNLITKSIKHLGQIEVADYSYFGVAYVNSIVPVNKLDLTP